MNIYTIDNEGYITGIKTVKKDYTVNPNDIEGLAPYEINHHYETGIKRPKSQEQLDQEEISKLEDTIKKKKILELDWSTEKTRLQELYGL